jgi:hypothetical protein
MTFKRGCDLRDALLATKVTRFRVIRNFVSSDSEDRSPFGLTWFTSGATCHLALPFQVRQRCLMAQRLAYITAEASQLLGVS